MQSPAPSEFFEGIKFNYSFYTTGDTKVTIEYVNNNFLKCVGYAYSRAISTSFNGILYALGGINTTDIIATGTITANLFQGSGAQITNLNASNISAGTLAVARGGTGLSTLALGQLLIGNDTNPITQSANLIWDITNNNLGIGKNPAQKLDVNGTIAATLFSGSGASLTGLTEGQIPVLTAAKIPSLDAATKLTGTIDNARLTSAISVTSFAGDDASITAINATNIGTGTINNARLPAAISVTSFAGDGASITNVNATNITGTIGVANGGTGVTTFGMNRILYGSGGNGAIATLADLTFDGSTLTCYGEFATYKGITWINNQNSRLSRALTANNFTTGAAIGDIVLSSDAKLHLVGGSTGTQAPALTVDAVNNIGIGKTNPSATSKLDIVGTTTMTNTTTLNLDIVKTSTTTGDVLNMRYDATNGIRYQQAYVAVNDVKYNIIQKANNVDINVLTIYKGNVGIGNTAPAATDKLSVTGNTKTTGTATIDTNLVVGGSAGIVGTSQFTGNMGIGKASDTTLKLDVLGNAAISGTTTTGTLRATNIGIGITNPTTSSIEIVRPVTTTTDLINMRYDLNNGLRIQQAYVAANDIKQIFIQKNNNVDTAAMIIYKGNVGIGNTTPLGLLHLGDASKANNDGHIILAKCTTVGSTRICKIGYNNSFEFVIGDIGGGNTLSTWIEQFKINYNAPANSLAIGSGGEVSTIGNKIGISGASPTLYLRHTNSAYRSAMVHCNGNTFYILTAPYGGTITQDNWATVGSGRWPLTIDLTNNNAVFGGNVNCTSFNSTGYIYCDGTFQARGNCYFQQDLWHLDGNANNRFYFASSACTYFQSGTGSLGRVYEFRNSIGQDVAHVEGYYFYCYGPGSLSDRRIKRDIEEINDETALNMILLVQPTTYYYRDEARNKGNGKVYGFIANQIQEVIPDAVMITKDIIANIYKTCLVYNKREIYYSIPQDVEIDTEVSILNKEGGDKGKRYKIKEIYEDHFVIDEDFDGDECFVFGYCVNDLHGLDKSYIYTLNVCATQELHRRMEAQDKRIKELETKLEKLILLSVINNN
jgi:hypothetical protein